ncbi:MAG: DUF2752 domain-containing protein [Phycisphaerae bacterium]|nr:DUF2752 domain-containing protein [Phycisphaerae bacterium]NIR63889.1 DUF2752 domain-containing protein [candidate division Zixibacteria bacterium]NIP52012.1 DUF2752 domain-containing protein [Phycisphaerae bacterium]NIS53789.1 DUF2752 domain-containing protein [Phycisphaerae bacterium]NIU08747.1 DUF2752 domain-containing protein [Phycisphaerae bacterium]
MKIEFEHVCRRPQWPVWAVIVVLVWLALGGAALLLISYYDRAVSLCLFKRMTGLPCPTCGFTRGVLSGLSGMPGRGWLYNPLLFSVLLLFFLVTGIRVFFARAVKIHLTGMERAITWLLAGGLFAANWAYVIFYVG